MCVVLFLLVGRFFSFYSFSSPSIPSSISSPSRISRKSSLSSISILQKRGAVEQAFGALMRMWCATVGAMQSTVTGVATFSGLMV